MSDVWSGDEIQLEVPLELMRNPLGFTIDGGGSLTKLIYRSREDFSNGEPIRGQKKGILRLRCCNMGHQEELLKFLKEKCDHSLVSEKSTTYFMTGVTTQFFKENLEEQFKIKTELMSEMTALETGFRHANQFGLKCHKTSENVFKNARNVMLFSLKGNKWKAKENSENSNKSKSDSSNPAMISETPISGLASELLSVLEPKEWIEKYCPQEETIKGPAILIMAGSAFVVNLIDNENKMRAVDYIEIAGKTLCGLAEEILGVKDFDELMRMADRGDSSKVNTALGDLASNRHKEDDWYAYLDKGFMVYSLGKLSSCSAAGKSSYAKDDLAAGLVEMATKVMSKVAILNARLYNINKVYVCGSLSRYEVFRSALEGHFAFNSLFSHLEGSPFVRLHCIDNPGFLCAFGTWMKNVEGDEKSENQGP